MKNIIIGIDGLELNVINHYIDELPGFRHLLEKKSLHQVGSVFPADSVPAWNTIFTGLDPSVHGIVRGKDYVESVEEFDKNYNFELKGNTFWDELSNDGKKVLILNPYLAYPPWDVNGVFISGPAFVEGEIKVFPENEEILNKEVFGGYRPIKAGSLEKDIDLSIDHTNKLVELFLKKYNEDSYDLAFVTFTTLDRIQHYTWRFFDKEDPLHEHHAKLSFSILKMLKIFDKLIMFLIDKHLGPNDNLIIISDHGFSRRPYNLINFNEILRKEGLLILNKKGNSIKSKAIQILKNNSIKFLSRLKLLDIVAGKVKKIGGIKELKMSNHIIDKKNSRLFSDDKFSGKNPCCGFRLGSKTTNLTQEKKKELVSSIKSIFKKYNLPEPLWIKWREELFHGKFQDRYPDICLELDSNYGVEFDLFGKTQTTSSTHYKISGGHLKDGVFAFYNKRGNTKKINSINHFKDIVIKSYIKE
jgi:predicted AlkP superfamily phosphohydrolase/phosphomutase